MTTFLLMTHQAGWRRRTPNLSLPRIKRPNIDFKIELPVAIGLLRMLACCSAITGNRPSRVLSDVIVMIDESVNAELAKRSVVFRRARENRSRFGPPSQLGR